MNTPKNPWVFPQVENVVAAWSDVPVMGTPDGGEGLTLRDLFAAIALSRCEVTHSAANRANQAALAYLMADAMLVARNATYARRAAVEHPPPDLTDPHEDDGLEPLS